MSRITIINGNAGDDTVIVDGKTQYFDLADFIPDDSIWAVQWYGDYGEVEYKEAANEIIDSIEPYTPIIEEFNRLLELNQPE